MKLRLHHFRLLFTELQRPLRLEGRYDELGDFDAGFRLIMRKHLVILAWWGIFNLIGGVVAMVFFTGLRYYFCMMGAVWGIINFAVAVGIVKHTFYRKFNIGSSFERLDAQRHVEKIMALNIGFDVAYVFLGLYLRERGFSVVEQRTDMWHGFGWAVILQGVFLLAQDILVTRLHSRNLKKAWPLLKGD